MAIDSVTLIKDIISAVSGVTKQDASTIENFAKMQLQDIAQQSVNFAVGLADHSIKDDEQQDFLDNIAEMTRSFANTLAGLMVVEAEKIWNAVVEVIWNTINTATGLTLSAPAF